MRLRVARKVLRVVGTKLCRYRKETILRASVRREKSRALFERIGSASYNRYLDECAKGCSCCPTCWGNPCAGSMAGGVCDAMPCRCGDGGELYSNDFDDDALETEFDWTAEECR